MQAVFNSNILAKLFLLSLLVMCATSLPAISELPQANERQAQEQKQASLFVPNRVWRVDGVNKPANENCAAVGQRCQVSEQCCSKRCLTYAAKCVS